MKILDEGKRKELENMDNECKAKTRKEILEEIASDSDSE